MLLLQAPGLRRPKHKFLNKSSESSELLPDVSPDRAGFHEKWTAFLPCRTVSYCLAPPFSSVSISDSFSRYLPAVVPMIRLKARLNESILI